jgi:hypothetical protein
MSHRYMIGLDDYGETVAAGVIIDGDKAGNAYREARVTEHDKVVRIDFTTCPPLIGVAVDEGTLNAIFKDCE